MLFLQKTDPATLRSHAAPTAHRTLPARQCKSPKFPPKAARSTKKVTATENQDLKMHEFWETSSKNASPRFDRTVRQLLPLIERRSDHETRPFASVWGLKIAPSKDALVWKTQHFVFQLPLKTAFPGRVAQNCSQLQISKRMISARRIQKLTAPDLSYSTLSFFALGDSALSCFSRKRLRRILLRKALSSKTSMKHW